MNVLDFVVTPPARGAHTSLYDLSEDILIATTLSDDQPLSSGSDGHDDNTLHNGMKWYNPQTKGPWYAGQTASDTGNKAFFAFDLHQFEHGEARVDLNGDDKTVVISATVIALGGNNNGGKGKKRLAIVQSVPRNYYFSTHTKLRSILMGVGIGGGFFLGIACVVVGFFGIKMRRGVQSVLDNVALAAAMKNDKVLPVNSSLWEVVMLAEGALQKMNSKLLDARAFMPQHTLMTDEEEEEENDNAGNEEEEENDNAGNEAEEEENDNAGNEEEEENDNDGNEDDDDDDDTEGDIRTGSSNHRSSNNNGSKGGRGFHFNNNGAGGHITDDSITTIDTFATGTFGGGNLAHSSQHTSSIFHPKNGSANNNNNRSGGGGGSGSNGVSPVFLPSSAVLSVKRVAILAINTRGFHSAFLQSGTPLSAIVSFTRDIADAITLLASSEKGVVDAFHGDHFILSFNAARANAEGPLKAVRCASELITLSEVLLMGPAATTTAGVAGGGGNNIFSNSNNNNNTHSGSGGGGGGGMGMRSSGGGGCHKAYSASFSSLMTSVVDANANAILHSTTAVATPTSITSENSKMKSQQKSSQLSRIRQW